jgi:hypothetical protein
LTTESELFKAGEVGSSKNILTSTLLRDLFAGGHLSGGTALIRQHYAKLHSKRKSTFLQGSDDAH